MDKEQADEILAKPKVPAGIILFDKDGIRREMVPLDRLKGLTTYNGKVLIYFDHTNLRAYGISNSSTNEVKDDHTDSYLHYLEIPYAVAVKLDLALTRVKD